MPATTSTAVNHRTRRGIITAKPLITHRLPLAQVARGFGLVLEGRESLKVIIRPQEG